jgi:hypothetical protein
MMRRLERIAGIEPAHAEAGSALLRRCSTGSKTMTISRFSYALTIGAVAALLTSCAGPQPQIGMPGTVPQTQNAKRAGSWILPEAKREGLLYVADITMGEVWVFTYPHGRFVGDLTGSASPAGECVDTFGDIFVTDSYNARILEYPHGGTQPLKTLNDPGYSPATCSVDPTSGDLAVTNVRMSDRAGRVAIYRSAVYEKSLGKPKQFADPAIQGFVSCAYDKKGDLFVDGANRQLTELSLGSRKFKTITLAAGIKSVGPLQWDGDHLTMGGTRGGAQNAKQIIRRLEISGSQAKSVGSTSLDDVLLGGAYFIDSDRVITPNGDMPRIQIFAYPGGGTNLSVIKHRFGEPVQVVISHNTP